MGTSLQQKLFSGTAEMIVKSLIIKPVSSGHFIVDTSLLRTLFFGPSLHYSLELTSLQQTQAITSYMRYFL